MAFSVKISGLLRFHMTFVFICLSPVILINKKGAKRKRYIYNIYDAESSFFFYFIAFLYTRRRDISTHTAKQTPRHCRPGMYGVQVCHCFRKRCYIVCFVAMCSLFFTPMWSRISAQAFTICVCRAMYRVP